MMIVENECVGCPPNMGCLGDSCPYKNVTTYYCDECEDVEATYHLTDDFSGIDKDVCNVCANELLNEMWKDLSICDKADLLGVELKKYG